MHLNAQINITFSFLLLSESSFALIEQDMQLHLAFSSKPFRLIVPRLCNVIVAVSDTSFDTNDSVGILALYLCNETSKVLVVIEI
jgi:hypothetical protein